MFPSARITSCTPTSCNRAAGGPQAPGVTIYLMPLSRNRARCGAVAPPCLAAPSALNIFVMGVGVGLEDADDVGGELVDELGVRLIVGEQVPEMNRRDEQF
jgi:hypothetical protein